MCFFLHFFEKDGKLILRHELNKTYVSMMKYTFLLLVKMYAPFLYTLSLGICV